MAEVRGQKGHWINQGEWNAHSIRDYWNRRALRFDKVHPRLVIIRRFIDSIPRSLSQVLDVGCGPGAVKRILPDTIEYFGVDIASEIIKAKHDPAHFEVVDLNNNPQCFGELKFDLVVCSGIFEYMQQPESFLGFLGNKVVDDGYLIISYTNRQHYQSIPNWIMGRLPEYVDPHFNFMSIPQAIRLLSVHGFRIIRRTSVTRNNREPRFFSRSVRFPLNALSRQFIFLCQHTSSARS